MEERASSSSPERKPAGRRVLPPSPGRKFRLEAGKSVRRLGADFVRAARKFLKADQVWMAIDQIAFHERVCNALYKRANNEKAYPKWALRQVVACYNECKYLEKQWHERQTVWGECLKEAYIGNKWRCTRLKKNTSLSCRLPCVSASCGVCGMEHHANPFTPDRP